jgi:hypothetical protein
MEALKMAVISISVKSEHDAAKAYVLSRRKSQFLSTGLAVRAIRTLLPRCEASDRELEDMVAAVAIEHGLSIAFDGKASLNKGEASIINGA